jgi:ABC-type sugar transport system ATPase subunit
VLLASSELEELQLICHRVAVMNHGRVVAVLGHDEATKEAIMTAAAGTGALPELGGATQNGEAP